MGFLKRLFGAGGSAGPAEDGPAGDPPTEAGDGASASAGPVTDGDPTLQRVVCWVPLADPSFESPREQTRLFGLEDRLMRAAFDAGVGDLDTNDLGRGWFAIRLQGRDAQALAAVLLPLLGDAPRGTYLAVRRGPYGAPEDRVDPPT